ncbi:MULTISPECIES: hypothetical protein [Ralstonia]|uniref:hypothetical protein n=1 Tax=Ralstonia TaxID=48736 RepID=UPI003516F21E
MELEDITHCTIAINCKVREFGGDYDGRQTKIKRGGDVSDNMVGAFEIEEWPSCDFLQHRSSKRSIRNSLNRDVGDTSIL